MVNWKKLRDFFATSHKYLKANPVQNFNILNFKVNLVSFKAFACCFPQ